MDSGLEDLNTETTQTSTDIEDEEPSSGSGFWHFIKDVLETLVLAVLLFMVINAVSARIRVDGSSMVPTLDNGQFVMVNRIEYKFSDPEYGEIVVFHYPRDPDQEYIKRIIGLPGDTVRIVNGHVYVNDQELSEPYIAASTRAAGEWQVPGGHIFVLGDNRNNSQDSRNFGFVSMDNVVGKAFLVYWPPNDWNIISSPEAH